MMASPLRAFIGTPLTSILTSSSLKAPLPSGRPRLRLDYARTAVIDHVFELVAEVLEEALHRPGRGIAEGADGMSFDVVGDIEQHAELLAPALPVHDAFDGAIDPAGTLAAGRALTARLGFEETRDALERAHHAGGLVHHDHARRTDRGARRLQRVVIHVELEHGLGGHDRHRDTARNHRL